MIDKSELLSSASFKRPYQAEKDYLEEAFLSGIFNTRAGLVFKGGTALSKIYGSARFSDDLDFALFASNGEGKLKRILDEFIEKMSSGIPLRILRTKDTDGSLSYELSIRGPLFEQLNKFQHLKIEIDKKVSVLDTTVKFRKIPIYRDLKPYLALVLSQKEIFAEKLVALLYRHNLKARDLYDLYFEVRSGIVPNIGLIDRKMREFGHTLTKERFFGRVEQIRNIWEKELSRLIPEDAYVGFETAANAVVQSLRDSYLI